MHVKPLTVLFLLELEHCVENVYFKLARYIWCEWKIETIRNHLTPNIIFCIIVIIILYNNINNKKCEAIKMLHKIYKKDSLIDCKLLAYNLNNIIYDALYGK